VILVISVYFNLRNILPKSGTFPPGHPVYSASVGENRKDSDNIKLHGTTMKIMRNYELKREV